MLPPRIFGIDTKYFTEFLMRAGSDVTAQVIMVRFVIARPALCTLLSLGGLGLELAAPLALVSAPFSVLFGVKMIGFHLGVCASTRLEPGLCACTRLELTARLRSVAGRPAAGHQLRVVLGPRAPHLCR